MPLHERRTWLGLSLPAWLGACTALGLLAGLLNFLISLEPRKVEIASPPMEQYREQARVSREIDDIERRFRKLSTEQAAPEGWERELSQVILKQQQLMQLSPAVTTQQQLQLERLLVIRDTVIVQRQWDRVAKLEDILAKHPPVSAQVKIMEELLRLRQAINRSKAPARFKNLVREAQLERDLAVVQAEPLRVEADDFIARAGKAVDRKDWAEALEFYIRARELMEQINQRFPHARQADLGLETRLKSEEVSLQGAEESAEIEVLIQGGDAVAADRPESAAGYYLQAMELQGVLNQRWPHSRFVSTVRMDELTEKRQTVLSAALIEKMKVADRAAERALAGRQLLLAGQQIDTVQNLTRQLGEDFSRSQLADEGLGRKYEFLKSLGESIRVIQDDLYDHLLPLPGEGSLMLLQGEVSQNLYTQVMKFNPSRTPDQTLAVESLAWTEAQEFCRRLGWIMGREVRLPSRSEMRKALEDAAMTDRAVTLDAGNVPAARPSIRGYSNLRDNVAEWLEAADTAAEAWVLAGQAGARPTSPDKEPFATVAKDTRSRDLGFRVIVKLGVP
ncbi:MAG: hypothetical protein K9M98_04780 [Cephaloticoccus sp.]|nr:hypothetical protein [Cephaloticoccus sp.]MCF7759796.1 hypothetical protein [Cephaloticoccus sp.]